VIAAGCLAAVIVTALVLSLWRPPARDDATAPRPTGTSSSAGASSQTAATSAGAGTRAGPRPPPPTSDAATTRTTTSAPTGTPTSAARTPGVEPNPIATTADVAASWAALEARLGGSLGIAWVDAAGAHGLGSLTGGPAWSTIKVPLAIAALGNPTATTRANIGAAIRHSDNAAAAALWDQLGGGTTAAAQVDAVLRALGSSATATQAQQVHPPYTPYGQTVWALADQARFAAGLACASGAGTAEASVLATMGEIVADQRWGLGRLDGARFKGGWGPAIDGRYLVRQFGVLTVGQHWYAVALASRPASGTFAGGITDLDAIARWAVSADGPLNSGGARGLACG